MMLSVLVWLAMQLPYNSVDCDPQMRNGKEYQQCAVDAPAEHVIEIKTRRERFAYSTWGITEGNPVNDAATQVYCPAGQKTKTIYCFRVTRELWIDGQKFGVIKGLD